MRSRSATVGSGTTVESAPGCPGAAGSSTGGDAAGSGLMPGGTPATANSGKKAAWVKDGETPTGLADGAGCGS